MFRFSDIFDKTDLFPEPFRDCLLFVNKGSSYQRFFFVMPLLSEFEFITFDVDFHYLCFVLSFHAMWFVKYRVRNLE